MSVKLSLVPNHERAVTAKRINWSKVKLEESWLIGLDQTCTQFVGENLSHEHWASQLKGQDHSITRLNFHYP